MTAYLILADVLQDDHFYNVVVNCITKLVDPSSGYLTYMATQLYKHLPEGSPTLQLVVDLWVYGASVSRFNSSSIDYQEAPREFWVEVAKGLVAKASANDRTLPWSRDLCKYHKHSTDPQDSQEKLPGAWPPSSVA